MKKIAKIVLLSSLFLVFQYSNVLFENVQEYGCVSAKAKISEQEVLDYLRALDYSVYSLKCDFDKGVCYAETLYQNVKYLTIVYIVDDKIVDHENVPM